MGQSNVRELPYGIVNTVIRSVSFADISSLLMVSNDFNQMIKHTIKKFRIQCPQSMSIPDMSMSHIFSLIRSRPLSMEDLTITIAMAFINNNEYVYQLLFDSPYYNHDKINTAIQGINKQIFYNDITSAIHIMRYNNDVMFNSDVYLHIPLCDFKQMVHYMRRYSSHTESLTILHNSGICDVVVRMKEILEHIYQNQLLKSCVEILSIPCNVEEIGYYCADLINNYLEIPDNLLIQLLNHAPLYTVEKLTLDIEHIKSLQWDKFNIQQNSNNFITNLRYLQFTDDEILLIMVSVVEKSDIISVMNSLSATEDGYKNAIYNLISPII